MESQRFEPDPAIARRRVWATAAVFIATGLLVMLRQNTVSYVMGGIFCAIGVMFVALVIFMRPTPDRFATIIIDKDGFTLHKPPDTHRQVPWTGVKATWPYQQHLVVKLETGAQVLVPLVAQSRAARGEITAMFRANLGDRFTSYLNQKL